MEGVEDEEEELEDVEELAGSEVIEGEELEVPPEGELGNEAVDDKQGNLEVEGDLHDSNEDLRVYHSLSNCDENPDALKGKVNLAHKFWNVSEVVKLYWVTGGGAETFKGAGANKT